MGVLKILKFGLVIGPWHCASGTSDGFEIAIIALSDI